MNMSTTAHPQTDSQSKGQVQTVEDMLRTVIQDHSDWDSYLPVLEYEHNAARNASHGLAPFEVDLVVPLRWIAILHAASPP